MDNRFTVLPEVLCNKLINSDKLSANTSGDPKSAIRTGLIGRIGNMDVYSSNLLNYATNSLDSNSTCFNPIFGHKSAMTFAWQLVQDETLKNQEDFGDIHRGLQVFGWKVVRPEALGTCVVKVATS
jgi:hypothetical protein